MISSVMPATAQYAVPGFDFCQLQRFVNNLARSGVDTPYPAFLSNTRLYDDRVSQYGFVNGDDPVPHAAGVYIIVCFASWMEFVGAQHVLYVGSSKDMATRISHPEHWWSKIADRLDRLDKRTYILWRETDQYRWVEKCLIRELKPWLNIQHNG